MNILVLGFYGHKNLGDDQYKTTFSRLFRSNDVSLTFSSVDCIDHIPSDVDAIMCGGGDIVNSYFMKSISALVEDFDGPVYAISVGFPYHSEAQEYLGLFDHVFVRTKTDLEFGVREVGADNIDYIPDLAWLLDVPTPLKTDQKKVALCLAQPMFFENPVCESLVEGIVDTASRLVDEGCKISLVPFNTYSNSRQECDIYISETVRERILLRVPHADVQIYNVNVVEDVMRELSSCNLVIGMRFHSIVFSAISNTPFVAVGVTNKVKNTMKDYECIQNVYEVELDSMYRPCAIDGVDLYEKAKTFMDRPMNVNVNTSLFDKCRKVVFEKKRRSELVTSHKLTSLSSIHEKMTMLLVDFLGLSGIEAAKSTYITPGAISAIQNVSHSELARMVVYVTTGSLNSPCFWGLCENLTKHDFVLKNAVDYIHNHHITNIPKMPVGVDPICNRSRLCLNLEPSSKEDYSQHHRAGWQYVMAGMRRAFDANARQVDVDTCLMFDDYVDKTFLWGASTLHRCGILPYKKPWVGVIHHTFHKGNGGNCCEKLFVNEYFLDSLDFCKCLITLSHHLKRDLECRLESIGVVGVPVHVLCHPTEFVPDVFDFNKFKSNTHRKIVQVGGWLRNPYPFYTVDLTSSNVTKAVLKGKDMQNVVVPSDLVKEINEKYGGQNTFVNGMIEMLQKNVASVEIIDRLDNDAYDALFTQNIVFLNLIDASAVNTVIECAVRNTPLIVNRHPSVEEMLGNDYPGFYDNVDQVRDLVSCENVEKIHLYLRQMDKTMFKLDTFLKSIGKLLKPIIADLSA